MSSYTIRLKNLLDSGFQIWDTERPFPLFSESHRAELQKMIEDHYYMQEIGFETPQTFKHYLNTRMREIMPKYNAMFETVTAYNPDMFEKWAQDEYYGHNGHQGSKGHQGSFTAGAHKDTHTINKDKATDISYQFETPMNMTSITNPSPDHMSGATRNDIDERVNEDDIKERKDYDSYQDTDSYIDDDNHMNTHTEKRNYMENIEQYRAQIHDIDRLIIEELGDLFMMIF